MKLWLMKKAIRRYLEVINSPNATDDSKNIAQKKLTDLKQPFGYHTPCLYKGCSEWVSLAWYCKRHYRY